MAEVVKTKKEAQEAVDIIFSSITDALKKDDAVTISGLGSFKLSKRAARKGGNPKTRDEIDIQAANVPKFAPGKGLKDAVK